MGIDWYLLCDEDDTAYLLGKGAYVIADVIAGGLRGDALVEAIRSWMADSYARSSDKYLRDLPTYTDRIAGEIEEFANKPRVRVDNDASWDAVWIDRGRGAQGNAQQECRIYRLVGQLYANPDELV